MQFKNVKFNEYFNKTLAKPQCKQLLILLFTVILAHHFQTSNVGVSCGHSQKRLLTRLFKNYSRLERPVANENETLLVYLGMTVQQIVDIVSVF